MSQEKSPLKQGKFTTVALAAISCALFGLLGYEAANLRALYGERILPTKPHTQELKELAEQQIAQNRSEKPRVQLLTEGLSKDKPLIKALQESQQLLLHEKELLDKKITQIKETARAEQEVLEKKVALLEEQCRHSNELIDRTAESSLARLQSLIDENQVLRRDVDEFRIECHNLEGQLVQKQSELERAERARCQAHEELYAKEQREAEQQNHYRHQCAQLEQKSAFLEEELAHREKKLAEALETLQRSHNELGYLEEAFERQCWDKNELETISQEKLSALEEEYHQQGEELAHAKEELLRIQEAMTALEEERWEINLTAKELQSELAALQQEHDKAKQQLSEYSLDNQKLLEEVCVLQNDMETMQWEYDRNFQEHERCLAAEKENSMRLMNELTLAKNELETFQYDMMQEIATLEERLKETNLNSEQKEKDLLDTIASLEETSDIAEEAEQQLREENRALVAALYAIKEEYADYQQQLDTQMNMMNNSHTVALSEIYNKNAELKKQLLMLTENNTQVEEQLTRQKEGSHALMAELCLLKDQFEQLSLSSLKEKSLLEQQLAQKSSEELSILQKELDTLKLYHRAECDDLQHQLATLQQSYTSTQEELLKQRDENRTLNDKLSSLSIAKEPVEEDLQDQVLVKD